MTDDQRQVREAWKQFKGLDEAVEKADEVPVMDVMRNYSAERGGNHSFSFPRIPLATPAGSKQKEAGRILDNAFSLIQGVALTRGGQSQVVQRDDSEGGVIIRISLPASGIIAPSGVQAVFAQIVSVVRNEYPMNVALDCLDVRSVGLGSPVSASDGQHILTVRVLAKLPQNLSPTNNLYNRDATRGEE